MDVLTDIAKDYLADFEVLTEARKEFETQLEKWWPVLAHKRVKAALAGALKGVNGNEPNVWDNQSRPGLCIYQVIPYQEVMLQITDPRASERGCYTVSLLAASQPALKKLSKLPAFTKSLDELAGALSEKGLTGVKKSATELVAMDVRINPDDPEETARLVTEAAVRLFGLVIEHHRITSVEAKS